MCFVSKPNPIILLECRNFHVYEIKHFSVGLAPSKRDGMQRNKETEKQF